jgi:hypothetical protein
MYAIIKILPINFEVTINTRTTTFFKSDEGVQLRDELTKMTQSSEYNTRTMYSTSEKDGLTFIDKHMKYMSQYPSLNCRQYVLNLKLMTKIRTRK